MSHGITIPVLKHPLNGEARLPGSKSITNRALIIAALANGKSRLTNVLFSDDTIYMTEALAKAGFKLETAPEERTIWVEGGLGQITARERTRLFVGNAGTAMRFLTAALCLTHNEYEITGTTRMRERPIFDLLEALASLGAQVFSREGTGCPPVVISGAGLEGGECQLGAKISSQFVSALMLAAPYAKRDVTIRLKERPVSLPYIIMTQKMMESFGVRLEIDPSFQRITIPAGQTYQPLDYEIESDASSASYFLAAPAITGGSVKVLGIPKNSLQGDALFGDYLKEMGAQVSRDDDGIRVSARSGELKGIKADLHDLSDTFPTLAVLALFARGSSTIHNIENVRYKECDRIRAVGEELEKLGAKVEELKDGLVIHPPADVTKVVPSGPIKTWDDHRIAMAFSLAGLVIPGVEILDPECVAKTWPDFFQDLAKLSGR